MHEYGEVPGHRGTDKEVCMPHIWKSLVYISHVLTCCKCIELLDLSGVPFSPKTHNGRQGPLKRAVVLEHHSFIRPTESVQKGTFTLLIIKETAPRLFTMFVFLSQTAH